jgi:hypothetical protein
MRDDLRTAEWSAVAAEIDACRQQLRECERVFGYSQDEHGYHEDERYGAERSYLGFRLRQAFLRMLILIERAELSQFLTNFRAGFAAYEGKLEVLGHSPHDPEDLYSEPLIFMDQSFDALSAMLRGVGTRDQYELGLLERILRQTPYILANRGTTPISEKDVRQPVFDVLKTVFSDCRREIPVSHLFKTYRADLGVPALKALVEFKYALDEKELKSELDGVYADMNGYAGDPQWNRFFAVFYTATPVAAPERILEEFKLSRADMSWQPIIVHGTGTRPNRKPVAKVKPTSSETVRRKRSGQSAVGGKSPLSG